jgi:hypothetical protein
VVVVAEPGCVSDNVRRERVKPWVRMNWQSSGEKPSD